MKTIEIGLFEAKNKLSVLLEMAARGQRIIITRRGAGHARSTAVSIL
jgi:prevent-host-death family protein